MPPSSRKRNKGKERKAKQLAQKEEIDRAIVHRIWTGWVVVSTCNHGYEIVIPTDDHPVSSFMDQFYINLHHKGMSVSKNLRAIFQTHTQILNNEIHRKLVLDTLVHIGTNMMLSQGQYDIANALCVAQSIVALEHFEHCDCSNVINFAINKRVVIQSGGICNQNSSLDNERDALKFYCKRISCKCLKKLHLEVWKQGSSTKVGYVR